jgi:hypothetical protein
MLREIAKVALDFHRRGAEHRELGWRLLGIREDRAAALLTFLLDYLRTRMKVDELRTPEIALLESIARSGR